MLRTIQFIVGILLLLAIEFFRVYFIMPFPGSQQDTSIETAYFINDNIYFLRLIGALIIVIPALQFFVSGSRKAKILTGISLAVLVFAFYLFNIRFAADKMFKTPEVVMFADTAANVINRNQQVLGVVVNGKAKAYPVQLIGYHHQVRDTLGTEPLMVTYCTVCRTGRVFKPVVNGKIENFRLVGMDHFNAMFEDETTHTWWRQVNGEAIVGPLKGSSLEEIPYVQLSLGAWLAQYPDSRILQPDSAFTEHYEKLEQYDAGKTEGELLRKDSLSWKDKSWIVGVQIRMTPRAYDWIDLVKNRVINDTLAATPIVVALEADSLTFHVWHRDSHIFELDNDGMLTDINTHSTWNWSGRAINGSLIGSQLPVVQAYQEYWHSWRTFRPQTSQYKP